MSSLSVGSSTSSTAATTSSSSGSSGTAGGGLNFTGLASGIDTSQIIAGIQALAQKKITSLQDQGNAYLNKKTAFTALQTNLYALQTDANQLARSAGGAFDGHTATASNTSALSATAGTAAVPGTYTLTVAALAQANQVASQGFADPNATLKQGSVTIQVGSGTPITVTLNGQNNTLQGLATAINSAGGGVQASVVNDGSATPYRLMLTAKTTGAANTIAVTNNLTTGTGADINPTQTTVQAAGDAQVTVGSGAGALTVSSGTNQLNNLIPGVSLNLLQTTVGQPVTLTVANDTDTATKAVQNFVDGYNAVVDFVAKQTAFDPTSQQAGLLLGDPTTTSLQNDLSAALNAAVPGLKAGANQLAAAGLSFDATGHLKLNAGTLAAALGGQNGVSSTDIKNLFAVSGTSDNPGVQFVLGSAKTQPSGAAAFKVQITAPATRGTATATTALANSVTIGATNNTLSLSVNGTTSAPITLDSGTYTRDALATMIQQKVNASTSLNGNLVAVGLTSDGRLQLTSQTYGTGSQVKIGTGSAVGAGGPLGLAGTESGTGVNVAGNFVVNGKTEAATGVGQLLTGNAGNANTDGLAVRATASAAGTANLTVSQGLAGRLNQTLNKYLDPSAGLLPTASNGFQGQIDDINKQITTDSNQLQTQTTTLQQQFTAMETAISGLKNIQTQLTNWATKGG